MSQAPTAAPQAHAASTQTRLINYRPPRIAMFLLALALAWHCLLPSPGVISAPLVAIPTITFGLLVMMVAWWQFRQHRVAICPTAKTDYLVTDGIYRYTRNPMYLGITIMLCGIAVGFGTLPFALAALAFFLIIDRAFCPYEEQKLSSTFGEAYDGYRRRVRRWIQPTAR